MIEPTPTKRDNSWATSLKMMAKDNELNTFSKRPIAFDEELIKDRQANEKYDELINLYTKQYSEADANSGMSFQEFQKAKEAQIEKLKDEITELDRKDLVQRFYEFVENLKEKAMKKENEEILAYIGSLVNTALIDKNLIPYFIDVEKRLRRLESNFQG